MILKIHITINKGLTIDNLFNCQLETIKIRKITRTHFIREVHNILTIIQT